MQLNVPAYPMMVITSIIPIVNFEIFDEIEYFSDFIRYLSGEKEFVKEKSAKRRLQEEKTLKSTSIYEIIPDQMKALDYETYNPILNLGTISGVILIYFIKLIAYFVYFKPYKQKHKKSYETLKKQLFFKEVLLIFIEAYLENVFIGILSCVAPEGEHNNTL